MTNTAFDLETARRLPLADAAFRLFDYAFDEDFLNQLFETHRGRSYQGVISFPQLVHLVSDALLGHRGSAHQTFKRAKEEQTVSVSPQALYGKLRRVPIQLSTAFLAEATARLQTVCTPPDSSSLPPSMRQFRALAFDGKKLKYVAKRLKATRGLQGTIYGGKMLVVQDIATGQAIAIEADANGEVGDNPLVPPAVAQVRKLPDNRNRVWVGDRAFCDYPLLNLLSSDGDHFVVRFKVSSKFYADPNCPVSKGKDRNNRPYSEQCGWLGHPKHPNRVAVRQIKMQLAEEELIIVTSLLDDKAYPAADVLDLYRSRWGIEGMFLQLTQTFDLRHLIGNMPEATVFQAVLSLLIYNSTLIIRDHVALAAKQQSSEMSLKLFFDDLVRELTGWLKVIGIENTQTLMDDTRPKTAVELIAYLQRVLKGVWTNRWRKSPSRARPKKTPPHAYIGGGHTSVDKILRGEHTEIPLNSQNEVPPAEMSKSQYEIPPAEIPNHV